MSLSYFIRVRDNISNVIKRFIIWQKAPATAKPMSDKQTECLHCGQIFKGNFCPRCGQSATTTRIKVRNAFNIFLETWGFGSNSFFRVVRDLLLRPGFMIGDYLDGHRQPYLPPFKSLLVVASVYTLTLWAMNTTTPEHVQLDKDEVLQLDIKDGLKDSLNKGNDTIKMSAENLQSRQMTMRQLKSDMDGIESALASYRQWTKDHAVTSQLMTHLVFAFFAWRLFRRAPRRQGLSYAEQFITQVYICCQLGTLCVLYALLCIPLGNTFTGSLPAGLTPLLFLINYKQLFGYGWLKTIWKTMLTFLLYQLLVVTGVIVMIIVVTIRAATAGIAAQ